MMKTNIAIILIILSATIGFEFGASCQHEIDVQYYNEYMMGIVKVSMKSGSTGKDVINFIVDMELPEEAADEN